MMVGFLVREIEIGQVKCHEGDIAAERGHVQDAMIQDVPFPDLYEAPKVGTCFKAAVQKVTSERVQNHVNSLTRSGFHNCREEG